MFNLETINGKTYKNVPVELNGVIVKFVLVEVPSTHAVPIVAESEPADFIAEETEEVDSDFSEEAEIFEETTEVGEDAPDTPQLEIQDEVVEDGEEEIESAADFTPEETEEVNSDVSEEAEIVEETTEAGEDAPETPQLEIQDDVVEDDKEEVESALVASPIAPQTTIEVDSCVEDEDFDTRSESSTGSSTIDSSDDFDEEFPSLDGKVDSKTEKDAHLSATDKLSCYELDNDLKVFWPLELSEYFLIAVDGKYVFSKEDLADDELEHNLVFRKTRQTVNRLGDRRPVCYKPTYKTVQKIQVRTGPGSKYDASGVIPANSQVFVIQEGLLSCDLELVVDWMSLHLPENMVCEELVNSSAQNFDEYIETALIFDGVKEWYHQYRFDKASFIYALNNGRIGKLAKRAFPHMHEEFVEDVQAATQAMKVAAKTESGTLEAFAKLAYDTKAQQDAFLKAAKAANRKVKVMWTEDGVEHCGWISKRKNNKSKVEGGKKTKPLITRVMGTTAAPTVEVFNIKANIPSMVQPLDCTFTKDAWHYKENCIRKVPSRYFEGPDEFVHCFPPMSLYTKLAKSEIAKIVGSKNFNISWEGDFKLDRYRGMEKKRVVCDDGKTRLRNGYHIPNNYLTITFQLYSDANAFLKADLDETRFSGAVAEASGTYANLHPVPATMCQEYVQYVNAVEEGKIESSEDCALERGIHYVTV